MELIRIGFSKFRSIGSEMIFLDLRKKINLLVGENNCGKSNVLKALQWLAGHRDGQAELDDVDRHQRKQENRFLVRVEVAFDDKHKLIGTPDKPAVFDFEFRSRESACVASPFHEMESGKFLQYQLETTGRRYMGTPSAAQVDADKNEMANGLLIPALREGLPEVHLVPQFRQIRGGDTYKYDGDGIVKLLGAWQTPDIGKDTDEDRFQKVRDFLRLLLHLPDAELIVSHPGSQLIVRSNGLRLPLESYGTGVHELIILAIAVFAKDNVIFCIEEPEIHLHPLLQKELLEFLLKQTSNRYIITTHSPSLIAPRDDVLVTHLWTESGVTKGRPIETTKHALAALNDLGIKPSDLLQANAVVWVEGPSDRIYINKWLNLIAPELQEGVDYSIMFYGGKLLSHLRLDRETAPSPEDLIPLLRINQHSIIVIDSDKKNLESKISETKYRIQKECEDDGVLCWITDGREIENYLPVSAVSRAYKEFTGKEVTLSFEKFESLEDAICRAYSTDWKDKWGYDNAKPTGARRIVKHIRAEDLSEELKQRLDHVVGVIRKANGVNCRLTAES